MTMDFSLASTSALLGSPINISSTSFVWHPGVSKQFLNQHSNLQSHTMETSAKQDSSHGLCSNDTQNQSPPISLPLSAYTVFMTLEIILSVLIIFSNALTIAAIVRFRSLQSVTNGFIMSLSVADLALGCILPFCAILNHTTVITGCRARKQACFICKTFTTISTAGSLLNLLAIAVDRHTAIFYSLKYTRIMNCKRAVMIITSIWIYVLSVTLVSVWGFGIWKPNHFCSLVQILPKKLYLGLFVSNIIIFLTVTIALYLRIFKTAHKQRRSIEEQNANFSQEVKRCQKDTRVTKMMAMVLGVFLLCWIPYTILNVLHQQTKRPSLALTLAYKSSIIVLYSNSCMNSVIYSWRNGSFRKAFKKLLFCSGDLSRRSTLTESSTFIRNQQNRMSRGLSLIADFRRNSNMAQNTANTTHL